MKPTPGLSHDLDFSVPGGAKTETPGVEKGRKRDRWCRSRDTGRGDDNPNTESHTYGL